MKYFIFKNAKGVQERLSAAGWLHYTKHFTLSGEIITSNKYMWSFRWLTSRSLLARLFISTNYGHFSSLLAMGKNLSSADHAYFRIVETKRSFYWLIRIYCIWSFTLESFNKFESYVVFSNLRWHFCGEDYWQQGHVVAEFAGALAGEKKKTRKLAMVKIWRLVVVQML